MDELTVTRAILETLLNYFNTDSQHTIIMHVKHTKVIMIMQHIPDSLERSCSKKKVQILIDHVDIAK